MEILGDNQIFYVGLQPPIGPDLFWVSPDVLFPLYVWAGDGKNTSGNSRGDVCPIKARHQCRQPAEQAGNLPVQGRILKQHLVHSEIKERTRTMSIKEPAPKGT